MTPEGQLRSDILRALAPLEALGRCKVVPIEAGGRTRTQKGPRMSRAGTPDLLVLLPGGASKWLELKRPGKEARVSHEQIAWHASATLLGHEVVIVRSVEHALELCGVATKARVA